ncbi:hypothetical protein GCM10007071_17690 [Marinobacter zhanjiangensis]|uniref:Uncharacterized protein n=1 Tax=Marinobacter zhanjiangensis TaxID=578215 RepID=A0ABQ3AYP5_9GAMM|nr:hypothetical protein GCM10007071_17690 [Marinobacter zhanjiangensis]
MTVSPEGQQRSAATGDYPHIGAELTGLGNGVIQQQLTTPASQGLAAAEAAGGTGGQYQRRGGTGGAKRSGTGALPSPSGAGRHYHHTAIRPAEPRARLPE